MKTLYFVMFLICLSSLQCHLEAQQNSNNEKALKPLIESPLTFSKELPVDLSQANRKNHLNNPQLLHQEAEQNIAFIRNKSLPWLPLAAVITTVLIILFVRMLPIREEKKEIDPLAKAKALAQIKDSLQKLTMRQPKDDKEAKTSIMQMNTLLRMYLINQYDFPAFSYTAQELEDKLGEVEIDAELKEGIKRLFYKADRIKYAKDKITPEEFIELVSHRFDT